MGLVMQATGGLVQQGFGEMRGIVLRMNICAKFELWCFD